MTNPSVGFCRVGRFPPFFVPSRQYSTGTGSAAGVDADPSGKTDMRTTNPPTCIACILRHLLYAMRGRVIAAQTRETALLGRRRQVQRQSQTKGGSEEDREKASHFFIGRFPDVQTPSW